ncbi:MAG: hypothetical protein ACM3NV_04185 [Syntrophothermus sp.]
MYRKALLFLSLLAATALVVAPSASARGAGQWPSTQSFGETTLKVDSATLKALVTLGVTPGAVSPAKLEGSTFAFPITNRLGRALVSGVIKHSGGISLTAGSTSVALTDFEIVPLRSQLLGKVNGAGPVPLLDLHYRGAHLTINRGRLVLGPIGTTLTAGAAAALNEAFEVSAFTDQTVIGDATVRYRL